MNLREKHVVITGGSGDLGTALVEGFLNAGAEISVLDIDKMGLERIKEKFPAVNCHEIDLTSSAHVDSIIQEIYQTLNRIDILVNNAGLIFNAPLVSFLDNGTFAKHDAADWDRCLKINLSSAFYVSSSVAQGMLAARTKGVIVNICSISAQGNAGQSAYGAAKAGLVALTKTWAKELSPLGIRCVGIAPGFIDTPSTRKALSENQVRELQKRIPLRRLGKSEEFVRAVISVVENDYLNGKILELDGGLTL